MLDALTGMASKWSVAEPQADYLDKWLTQVYETVKPPSGNGKLLWHPLGAKTIELVHENVHLDTMRDDLDTLVMDAYVLEGLLNAKDPDKTPSRNRPRPKRP